MSSSMNSTNMRNNYKPKPNVDKRRKNVNADSFTTLEIPFNIQLETGTTQSVYSVDCMSMLSSSDTFNHFAKVFDAFKIQSYHLCVDLSRPSLSSIKSRALFQLPYRGSFKYLYTIVHNGTPYAINSLRDFEQSLCDNMLGIGAFTAVLDGQGDIIDYGIASFGNEGTRDAMLDILALWLQRNGSNRVSSQLSVVENTTVDNVDHPRVSVFNNDYSISVSVEGVINNEGEVNAEVTSYQQIGCAGLRQIPKNFFCSTLRVNDATRVLPDIYSDGFVESIGNYIHQSYMPGASLHLSMDMKGTSATEKSLYFPTSVVYNLSALDSYNQSGRFCPVTFIQNKVQNNNDRDSLVNGNGFVGAYVDKFGNNVYGDENDVILVKIHYTITKGNDVYIYTIPYAYAPYDYDTISNVPRFDSEQRFEVIGQLDLNNNNLSTMNETNYINWVYRDVNLSQMAYCMYDPNGYFVRYDNGSLSIQAYTTIRFKTIRNTLQFNKVVYPYLIMRINGAFTVNGLVNRYNDCNIVPLNVGNNFSGITLNQPNDIKMVMRSVDRDNEFKYIYMGCMMCTDDTNFDIANQIWSPEITVANPIDLHKNVLGGIIIPMQNDTFKYAIFNTFSVVPGQRYTVRNVIGRNDNGNGKKYVVICLYYGVKHGVTLLDPDYNVRNDNQAELPLHEVPDVNGQYNGDAVWNITNPENFSIQLNISRVRSAGFTDGTKNACIEQSIDPQVMKDGCNTLNMATPPAYHNGLKLVRSFGGIVGNILPDITNQL